MIKYGPLPLMLIICFVMALIRGDERPIWITGIALFLVLLAFSMLAYLDNPYGERK